MITVTVSVRGWSNEPSPLLSTTEPSTGPTGPVEACPAKVAVPSPPAIPPVALKISDSSGITHQTVYTSPGTRPDVWITQVIPLLLRTSWAEPTLTGLAAMVLTEAKSWSAAFGSCALSKVATAIDKPTARTIPEIFLWETVIEASSFRGDATEGNSNSSDHLYRVLIVVMGRVLGGSGEAGTRPSAY